MKKSYMPVLILVIFLTSFSSADQIVLEMTATLSGSVGDLGFTNESVTIRGVGDTENVFMNGASYLLLDGLQVTAEAESFGTITFTDAIQAVSNGNSELGGFGNTSNGNGLLFVFNSEFETYDLQSDLDPVFGTGFFVTGIPHATDFGNFRIFEIVGLASFSAELMTELLGDVNCDGEVNLLDVSPFVELVATGGYSTKADLNFDGAVDLLDVAPFVKVLSGN